MSEKLNMLREHYDKMRSVVFNRLGQLSMIIPDDANQILAYINMLYDMDRKIMTEMTAMEHINKQKKAMARLKNEVK